jgi:hypothetical protein
LSVISSKSTRRFEPERAPAACLDIADLRDGRREPLSRLPTRHGRPGRTLTLGALRGPRRRGRPRLQLGRREGLPPHRDVKNHS